MNRVYLISGGNMGNRAAMLARAEVLLSEAGKIVAHSSLYETAAWGMKNAPSFLNRVVEMETGFTAVELMQKCLNIESTLGRERNAGTVEYESRTIDIDLLFFNTDVIQERDLVVPHPRLHLRRFVLTPLNEVAPDFIHPVFKKKISQLLAECEDMAEVKRL